MDGYFKANFKNEKQELHALKLEDCDFVPDDEAISRKVVGRKHTCPRCRSVTVLQTPDCPSKDSRERESGFPFSGRV